MRVEYDKTNIYWYIGVKGSKVKGHKGPLKAFPSKLVQLIDMRYMEIMETFLCGKWCIAMATFYCFFMLPPHRVQEVLCFGVDTVIANERLYLWRYL